MSRYKTITLNPNADDALFVLEQLALHTCLKHECDVEFEFRGQIYRCAWSHMSTLCKPVRLTGKDPS